MWTKWKFINGGENTVNWERNDMKEDDIYMNGGRSIVGGGENIVIRGVRISLNRWKTFLNKGEFYMNRWEI